MSTIERFRELHAGPLFVMPNPWDIGSARILESLGFQSIATTSAGLAHSLGRTDGSKSVFRDEAIAHSAEIVGATSLPVNGDLEGGFGDDPGDVAETIQQAIDAGLAGCSIEDATGRTESPIYDIGLAVERITAAVEAAAGTGFVVTARAENLLFGIDDLADTIDRLQRFQEVGADVVYAPGLSDIDQIRSVVESVDVPVNVLARASLSVAALAHVGVQRVSLGSALSRTALGAFTAAAQEIRESGTFTFAATTPDFDMIERLVSGNG